MIFAVERGMPVVVQGITGHQGRIHASSMRVFGTNVVGGVVPSKGGSNVDGLPVFSTMDQAVRATKARATVIFVPATTCLDAAIEAIEAGIEIVVVITEHLPLKDAVLLRQKAMHAGTAVIGPNCPGIGIPDVIKLGIMPNHIFSPGNVGVISRSGTLTYEMVQTLTDRGIGQRCCVGIGGDPVVGTRMAEVAREYVNDDGIRAILLIGEIGGMAEIEAAEMLASEFDGPVLAYLAGRTAPPGKRMGHAGAIMAKGMLNIHEKGEALSSLGVIVCERMGEVAPRMYEAVANSGH